MEPSEAMPVTGPYNSSLGIVTVNDSFPLASWKAKLPSNVMFLGMSKPGSGRRKVLLVMLKFWVKPISSLKSDRIGSLNLNLVSYLLSFSDY